MIARAVIAIGTLALAGCAPGPGVRVPARAPDAEPELVFTELAPGLRVDRAARVVEFDGHVAVDAHHPETPVVYLELLVCAPDTREHESLVVTRVRPSLLHAALLASGFEPGSPGRVWVDDAGAVRRRPATGTEVVVEFLVESGEGWDASSPWDWVREREGGADARGAFGALVFSGSRITERAGRAIYDADGTGVIVGLTTFGSEVIAPVRSVSPESAVDEPAWIARAQTIPRAGTPVKVRVRAVE